MTRFSTLYSSSLLKFCPRFSPMNNMFITLMKCYPKNKERSPRIVANKFFFLTKFHNFCSHFVNETPWKLCLLVCFGNRFSKFSLMYTENIISMQFDVMLNVVNLSCQSEQLLEHSVYTFLETVRLWLSVINGRISKRSLKEETL